MRRFHAFSLSKKKKKQTQKCDGHLNSSSENSSKKADEKSADAPKRINVSFRKKLFGRSSNRHSSPSTNAQESKSSQLQTETNEASQEHVRKQADVAPPASEKNLNGEADVTSNGVINCSSVVTKNADPSTSEPDNVNGGLEMGDSSQSQHKSREPEPSSSSIETFADQSANEILQSAVGRQVKNSKNGKLPPKLTVNVNVHANARDLSSISLGPTSPDVMPQDMNVFKSSYFVKKTERQTITEEFRSLALQGWYWGPLSKAEAEVKLNGSSDGSFLVRDSSDERYLLSLSFRSQGRTLHTRIEHSNGRFSFYENNLASSHTSVVTLINDSIRDSQTDGVFCYSRSRDPNSLTYPVRLVHPVSRFTQVRSLQYLCRFVIRQYTRVDHIETLPVPWPVKGYLNQSYF